ncbi:MAG: DUF2958 domain-containing protein [Rhodomicrobium sp.]
MTAASLLSAFQRARLEANGRAQAAVKGTIHEIDFEPVVRLHDREEGLILLLCEIDPTEPHKAWGLCLCDPDSPEPYMGTVDLNELERVHAAGFLSVDKSFVPAGPVSDYLFRAQLDVLDL